MNQTVNHICFAVVGSFWITASLSAAEQRKDLSPITVKPAAAHPPVVLVGNGEPQGSIAVMNPKVAAAASLLQEFIRKATGATLPITKNKITPPAIVLGDCHLAEQNGLVGKDMPIEGFAIKTIPDHILIVGRDETIVAAARSQGTYWGACDFLERFVGIRWYFPLEHGQSIPQTKTLRLTATWLEDAPAFRKRDIWPPMANPWTGSGTQLGSFHKFLRSGLSWPNQLAVHQPDWSKVKEYVEGRPEVFQLRTDGTRDLMMLCYGHPKTLQTYLENIEKHVTGKQPVRLGIVGKAITVSPADAEIACNCEYCKKLWDEKGGQYGSASKIVGKFTADLGYEVKRRWPDMTVLYLPYFNYTQAPDGVKFPDNVEIQLAGMPGLAQYKEPSIAKSEQETIDKWIKLTGRKVQNWHYSCWPEHRTSAVYLFPHVIKEFYQANREKTVGSFINGTTDHWPRQHISLYCWMKVLWNPNFDVDAAIEEYCRRMYGPAAGTMRQLIALQMDGWEKSRWANGQLTSKAIFEVSFPRKRVQSMQALFEKARTEAGGDKLIVKRIDYYSAPFKDFFQQSQQYGNGNGFRPLLAMKVGESPKIDGKLDEATWQRATAVPFVRGWDKIQSEPKYPTAVKAVWTDAGITFGFHMHEPTPALLERGIKGRDDSMAWWDDNIELLFDLTGKNEGEFYHFIINPNNAISDAKGRDYSQNFPEVKTGAFVGQDFWSVEVFVRYSAFSEAVKPSSGSNMVWHGNFARHRVAEQGKKPKVGSQRNPLREYQRMNTTYASHSDNGADFAPIKFVE